MIVLLSALFLGACGGDDATETIDAGTSPVSDMVTVEDTAPAPQDTAPAPQDTAPAPQDTAPAPQDTAPPVPQGDGNDDFASAEALVADANGLLGVQAGLEKPDDGDYFTFTGKAGDFVLISTDAKPDDDPYADGYADLVLTLYNSDMVQIAENDDVIPRWTQDSRLETVLPADGTYYIRIMDFCYWAEVETGSNPCEVGYSIATPGYALGVSVQTFEDNDGNHHESEGATITYESNAGETASGYYSTIIAGAFNTADETDVYDFAVPADLIHENGLEATFYLFPAGKDGNGSSADVANAWITDADDNVISKLSNAYIDPTFGGELLALVEGDAAYKVHVQNSGDPGTNGFYILLHYGSGTNPLEMDDEGNNLMETAEALSPATTSSGGLGYFVAGTIGNDAADTDIYKLDTTTLAAGSKAYCACGSANNGSGLEGFTLTMMDADGTDAHTSTESGTTNANCGDQGITVPAGDHIYLRLTATGQSADVVGNFYRCGVSLEAPE
jgi:hypothetical protein